MEVGGRKEVASREKEKSFQRVHQQTQRWGTLPKRGKSCWQNNAVLYKNKIARKSRTDGVVDEVVN